MDTNQKSKVIALIQARGGSKGVPGKNIRALGGFPVLAWSIAACRLANKIDRVVLSTDSEEIAEIGRCFGAEVPFMRPSELASDSATDLEVFKHALEWFRDNEGHIPELIVQVRPTTPFRDPAVINAAIEAFAVRPDATGLRSVFEMSESAWKTFEMDNDGMLFGLINKVQSSLGPEASNLPRQAFPPTFIGQGYVDIVRSSVVLENEQMYGDRIMGFLTPDVGEIDSEADFLRLERVAEEMSAPLAKYLSEAARS